MAVTKLLEKHFPLLVDLTFTARWNRRSTISHWARPSGCPICGRSTRMRRAENQVKQHEEEIDPRTACTLEFEGLDAKIRIGSTVPMPNETMATRPRLRPRSPMT